MMCDSDRKTLLSYGDDGDFLRRSSKRLKKRQEDLLGEPADGWHAPENEQHEAAGAVRKERVVGAASILKGHRPVAGASAFSNDCGILPSE